MTSCREQREGEWSKQEPRGPRCVCRMSSLMARSHLCLFGSFIRLVYPNKPASRSHLCLFAHLSNPTAIAHNVPCYRFYRVQIVQRHSKGASTSASRCSVLNLDIATPKCSYACSTDRSSQ